VNNRGSAEISEIDSCSYPYHISLPACLDLMQSSHADDKKSTDVFGGAQGVALQSSESEVDQPEPHVAAIQEKNSLKCPPVTPQRFVAAEV
jgi:hypothetical protein